MQRNERVQQHYVASQQELDQFLFSGVSDILSWTLIGDYMIHMRSQTNARYSKPNTVANCIIGAHVTAYGRIKMHNALEVIQSKGGYLVYTDTGILLIFIH